MEKRGVLKRIAVFSLVFVMAAAFMPVFGMDNANAASKKKGRLVKSIEYQYYNSSTGKYEKEQTVTFKYNKKGDPFKIVTKYYFEGKLSGTYTLTNKYKYKKNVRKSRTIKDTALPYAKKSLKYDKKGNPKTLNQNYSYPNGEKNSYKTSLTYDKKGFLKKQKMTGGYVLNVKYGVKQKKGLLRKLTRSTYDNDLGKWIKTSTFTFDSKGIMKKEKYEGTSGYVSVKLKKKSGRVSTVMITNNQGDGNKYYNKIKIKYTKKKTTDARYAKMINSIIYRDPGQQLSFDGFIFAWH